MYCDQTIFINFNEFLNFHSYFFNSTNFSIYQILEIVISHEYGHSTRMDRKENEQLYNELFSDWGRLDPVIQTERLIIWRKEVIKEEIRAWEVAKKHLQHLKQDKLQIVIDDCLMEYNLTLESLENEYRQLKCFV